MTSPEIQRRLARESMGPNDKVWRKKDVYADAAQHVNEMFRQNFDEDQVDYQLKHLRSRFSEWLQKWPEKTVTGSAARPPSATDIVGFWKHAELLEKVRNWANADPSLQPAPENAFDSGRARRKRARSTGMRSLLIMC